MLVISQALSLSLTDSAQADYPLIGWHNLVTISGITADHEDADYPASNLANPATAILQGWKSDSTADQYVTFDISSEDEVDYLGIANHNFGGDEDAGEDPVEVSVEYPDPDNPGDWLNLVEPFIPADGAPLLLRFVPDFLSQIRIKLVPGNTAPRMSVVYIGALLVVPRKIYVGHQPITLSRDTTVQSNWSEGGDYLGAVLINERRSTSFSFNNLSPSWVRDSLVPFLRVSKTVPHFWAWRPGEYPDEVGFVIVLNNPKPSNQRANGMMSIDFQVSGIAP